MRFEFFPFQTFSIPQTSLEIFLNESMKMCAVCGFFLLQNTIFFIVLEMLCGICDISWFSLSLSLFSLRFIFAAVLFVLRYTHCFVDLSVSFFSSYLFGLTLNHSNVGFHLKFIQKAKKKKRKKTSYFIFLRDFIELTYSKNIYKSI